MTLAVDIAHPSPIMMQKKIFPTMSDYKTRERPLQQKMVSQAPTTMRAALILAMTLLILLAGVAMTVLNDSQRRKVLEQPVEETAVGDTDYQIIGDRRINHHTVEATLQGQPLYFAYLKEIKVDDAKMRRICRDDENRFFLYRPDDAALQKTADGRSLYYVKRKPQKYAQLHDRPEELLPRVLGKQ